MKYILLLSVFHYWMKCIFAIKCSATREINSRERFHMPSLVSWQKERKRFRERSEGCIQSLQRKSKYGKRCVRPYVSIYGEHSTSSGCCSTRAARKCKCNEPHFHTSSLMKSLFTTMCAALKCSWWDFYKKEMFMKCLCSWKFYEILIKIWFKSNACMEFIVYWSF